MVFRCLILPESGVFAFLLNRREKPGASFADLGTFCIIRYASIKLGKSFANFSMKARLNKYVARTILWVTFLLVVVTGIVAFNLLQVPHIGIVIGHWPDDSGATCQDGLQEVDINAAIARQVANELEQVGYSVDLLAEFDERLHNYQGRVLVSLHADSCTVDLSGFKVARHSDSSIPDLDDRLVDCLWEKYEAATSLSRDRNHITPEMYNYHVFRKIDPQTPAAIMEMGFLSGDRDLLTGQQQRVSKGITAGIRCFLEASLLD